MILIVRNKINKEKKDKLTLESLDDFFRDQLYYQFVYELNLTLEGLCFIGLKKYG